MPQTSTPEPEGVEQALAARQKPRPPAAASVPAAPPRKEKGKGTPLPRGRQLQPTAAKAMRDIVRIRKRKHRPTGRPKGQPGFKREPLPGEPEMPSEVGNDRIAKDEWLRVVPILFKAGTLDEGMRSTLGAYCLQFARWHRAEKAVRQQGMLKKWGGGIVASPFIKIADNAAKLARQFAVQLGLTSTPQATNNMGAGGGASPKNEWATPD